MPQIETETLAYVLIFAGWISFLAFLILPVYESNGILGLGADIFSRGFALILAVLLGFFGNAKGIFFAIICLIINLPVLLSPIIIYSNFIWIGRIYFIFASILSIVFTIIIIYKDETPILFIWTFYLWSLSFILITIGLNLL